MSECQCNICKIVACLRCPNKAAPILSEDTPQAKLVFTSDCLCNTCIIVECLRYPKKVEPILKEEPPKPEIPSIIIPPTPEKVVEKVIIIREPCPPRRINPCPDKTIPWIDPSRVTAYATGHPPRVGVYAVPSPFRTYDPVRSIAYGIPRNDDYRSITSTTAVHELYGVSSTSLSNGLNISDTTGSLEQKRRRRSLNIK